MIYSFALSFLSLAVGVVAQTNYTTLVNLFIGSARLANGGSGGNVFPGAAVPHAMAKVGIDVTSAPRQAGYIADNSTISGISLIHDEGTGGNTNGGYGLFPLFPLSGCSFTDCPVDLDTRAALRAAGSDAASPGYFTTTFVNGIQIETTSTRRAGFIRFTYPNATGGRFVVVDLTNDLGRSFEGGNITVTPEGIVQLQGTFLQSYGPDNYTGYGCYDFAAPGQAMSTIGVYQSVSASQASNITITPINTTTSLSYNFTTAVSPIQAGGLLEFNTSSVLVKFGISMISSEQACSNMNEEVPEWDFSTVQAASNDQWEGILSRVELDPSVENADIVSMLYSSLYRSYLVPANFSGENPYWDSPYAFYDSLFTSWDVFRTVHPWLSLTSPFEWAEIVNAYIDGWRHAGYIPEARTNTKPGYVQGGDDGMNIVGDFAVKYGAFADQLNIPVDDLYQALVDTAENTPPDWYTVGRQNTAWKEFNYIPTDWVDPSGSTGLPTREASRAVEYALNDFAVRQAAIALNKSQDDIAKYANRSMNFVNHWDPTVSQANFTGFLQRRYQNGTFAFSPPDACSPVDPVSHSCARGTDNDVGFYETSSWEMSFFAPQSMSTIVGLMGGNDTFVARVNHYFEMGYFYAGNEPGFEMPWILHYVGRPDLTALRVRQVIYANFGPGVNGLPGNDDNAAMAALLTFYLLGMYPVPASTQMLIGSPLVSAFTLHNPLFQTATKFTVNGFDNTTLAGTPPAGSRVFVKSVSIGGVAQDSICVIDWKDVVGGQEVVIEVDGDADAAMARGCGLDGAAPLPDSLETGGFAA